MIHIFFSCNLSYIYLSFDMSSQLSQILVEFYDTLSQNDIILPETEWEKFVNEAPSRYSVKWVIKNERTAVLTSDGSPLIKRGRQIDYNYVIHMNTHNHNAGSTEELQHLSLSNDVKNYIIDHLRNGYDKRDIRISIQNNFKKYVSNYLNFSVNIQQEKYQQDKNQYESVKLWLKELKEEKHFDTFIGDDFYFNFTFGFLSPLQKKILLESDSWCLDATHNTSNIARGLLYSIVVRNPLSGTGCPVDFLFTQNQMMWNRMLYQEFFLKLKFNGAAFMLQEHEMIWERRKPEFTVKLFQFIQDPEFVRITEFMEYFKQYYLDNDAFMMWTAAYQPQMYTNMETNNYIESWHNQLKTIHLKRKRNRRVDRLVRRRRSELVAHATNEEIIPEMITARFNDINNITAVQVRSSSSSDISYEVAVNDGILNAYSCQDFIFNKIPCKHIRLVKRLYSQFNISLPANSQSLLHQQNNNNIISNYANDLIYSIHSNRLLTTRGEKRPLNRRTVK
ncbi:MAG: hypothetical protein EXX96DRAFT_633530 [Benjaminiella poitrasii]|nr:MAG: hypothetical protein EXX96DRAFT_633530 [Benjaminiella poitrasii]